jgi:integrase
MSTELIVRPKNELATPLEQMGQQANRAAKTAVFADYLSRRSDNTIATQAAALALFADFLAAAGHPDIDGECLQQDPECWRGVTWGIVEAFVKWMLAQGFAITTVNNRLSAVKVYAKLATKAGIIDPQELALIKTVSGYAGKEAKRINERRDITRVGNKKAEHVSLTPGQAQTLTDWTIYAGEQGLRDCLMMCLLLEHGLRVGEVARLQVSDFDLQAGEMKFYRPKVDKVQTHKLTGKTYRALTAYLDQVQPSVGLLVGSVKGGRMTDQPMSERAITKRVSYLGLQLLGISKERKIERAGGYVQTREVGLLSAHDCRHFWATDAARNQTDAFRLQEAGGWSSLVMPRRYVEDAKIANEGVKLSSM